ncbi:peptidyl-prolyl cis-trans isomerase D [Aliiroseovarius halocynthiae]|uniref:Peptidylprolyl isomerase n=1 Tax=Aliiroseovarius halocynthiae TaxID=985055 RepID=A0A545SWT6_9RHOB|nr:SurA N-terminal domain-containing protein [Aliiroseovarius halocynthiae]TQV69421.1 peptidylprolyl isomerase [Aliiroseovarius halocynthiae]SMR72814.1 peptidyl-prolyl cis-trans isomerase D [Aliiroseovarius halocynthiae]
MATGKASRTFGWILMGLVMVGLVGFGSTNFGGSARSIGTVGDTEIDARRYSRELQSELNAFQAQTGQRLTMQQAQAFGVDQQVLARVISAVALEDETARLGISVGDDQLRARIVDIPAFAGVDGQFDRESYRFALEQSGLTASEFEQTLRAEVSRQILQAAVTNGIVADETYVDTLYGFAREARNFTWAELPVSRLTAALPDPTEDELTAYYDANPAAFTLPETKQITYAWLDPQSLISEIEVDAAQIEALYAERDAQYNQPERRLVERLVLGSQEEAQATADAIAAGETSFEDMVGERQLELADIDLGDVSKAELGAAGDAVFALDEPGIVGPLPTDLGPALFRVNAILLAQSTPLEDVRADLNAELAADAARRRVGDLVAELDDLMAGGATLEELGESHAMTLAQIDWTADSSDGIAAYEAFRDAATAAVEGDFPEITLMSDGGVFALRVDAVEPTRVQDQSEVADAVLAGWQDEKRLQLLEEEARGMIPSLQGEESLASLGLTEIVEEGQERDAFVAGTPPAFLTEVFQMEAGDWQVVPSVDGVLLVRLDAVVPVDQNGDEATAIKANFASQTAQEIAIDIENAFARAVQTKAGIELNRPMINAVNAQFQ